MVVYGENALWAARIFLLQYYPWPVGQIGKLTDSSTTPYFLLYSALIEIWKKDKSD